jgi:hypothetical protein
MCKGALVLFFLVSALGLNVPAQAVTSLASYEPAEVNCLSVTSPDAGVIVTWPVKGGFNDIPLATEGEHVLELAWAGETDRKVEVKHERICGSCWFDLAGYDYILADVYLATESARSGIVGIWDDVFGWLSTVCVPCTTGEWSTVLFYVGNLENTCLDHIWAFLLEQVAGDDGKVYVDNLRLGSDKDVLRRQTSFAGYNWLLKDSGCGTHGPGPNYFSHSKENIWVDANDNLHLKIMERCEKWYCSEVILDASPGYGTYVFTVTGRVDLLDPMIVLGLFTWDTNAPAHSYREMDVEVSKWWDPNEPNNAQFVVQPWDNPGNRYRFNVDLAGHADETTTYEFTWKEDEIYFRSYYGDWPLVNPNDMIESWSYTGADIPPAGGENIRMNFWLLPPKGSPPWTPGAPPTDGQDAEVVIKDFRYLSGITAEIAIAPRTLNLKSKGKWITCYIRLAEQYDVLDIDASTVRLEGVIAPDRMRFDAEQQVAMAKFSRSDVQAILEPGEAELTVTGKLIDGTTFEGTDTVRVIKKGRKK